MQAAFAVSALISLVVVAMAWLLPGRLPAVTPATAEPTTEGTLEDELDALCEHGVEPATCSC